MISLQHVKEVMKSCQRLQDVVTKNRNQIREANP